MDRHDPHRVDVGLGQHRLGHSRALRALRGRPREVGPQPAVLGLRPRARLVDDEPQPAPRIPRPRREHRDLEHPPVGRDPAEDLARRHPPRAVVQPLQVPDAGAHRVRGGVVVERGEQRERPAAALPRPQVVVPAPEQRRAQRGDERERIRRVGDGAGGGEEVADLLRGVDQRARLGAVVDAGAVEGVLEERQRGAGRDEDGDVAGGHRAPLRERLAVLVVPDDGLGRPPLLERGDDGARDVGRLALAHLGGAQAVVLGRPEDRHGRADLGALTVVVEAARRRAGDPGPPR